MDENPYPLESPHRPLRSADELVGEAGRFREPIPDGAGKDDLLRGAQVDPVTDTDEDRIDAVLRVACPSDLLSCMITAMEHDALRKGLLESLNSNGFSFQYAAITKIGQLWKDRRSPFRPLHSEFPVEVNGYPVHIDIILLHNDRPSYLVLECKRADPARANWCFVKVPPSYVDWLNSTGERLVREVVVPTSPLVPMPSLPPARIDLQWLLRTPDVYRLAFELRSDAKGDGRGKTDQLNTAVSQVLRGMNGLIALAARQPETFFQGSFSYAAFLPVVLTTARLWITDTDLTQAELAHGNLTPDQLGKLEECSLLFYQYPQSPGLKHAQPVDARGERTGLSGLLYREYTRTIAIVSAAGIQEFLTFVAEEDDWRS